MSGRRNTQPKNRTPASFDSLGNSDSGAAVSGDSKEDEFHVSPAMDLQYQIETAYSEPSHKDSKWSPRQTMAFVIIVCGAFWFSVIWAVNSLF